jgi:hypothetical protein
VLMEIVGGAWLRVDDYWMVLVVQLGAGDGALRSSFGTVFRL